MYIVGHRGAKGLAPENTIAGLKMGISHAVNAIEFDIRSTKDGVLVLLHDDAIETANGKHLAVRSHSYTELRAIQPDLCTLMEALRAIDKRVQALIEIKPGCNLEAIITDIRRLLSEGWQPQDFCFLSFEFRPLHLLHTALPEIPIIVNEMWSSIRATWRARKLGTKQIDLYQRWLWSGVISGLSRRGYKIYSFTINNPRQAQRWAKFGLYGVVTDFPDVMRPLQHEPPRSV